MLENPDNYNTTQPMFVICVIVDDTTLYICTKSLFVVCIVVNEAATL
jgi:hypothetical protein